MEHDNKVRAAFKKEVTMVKLGYLAEARNIDFKDGDLKLLVVRRPVNGVPFGFIHIPQLSPSPSLFDDTKRWKNGEFDEGEKKYLKDMGMETSPASWWCLYEPRFKKELEGKSQMKVLERIVEKSKESDIWLFCYCKDTDRCHRSIVGERLKEMGVRINFRRIDKEEIDNQMTFFEDF